MYVYVCTLPLSALPKNLRVMDPRCGYILISPRKAGFQACRLEEGVDRGIKHGLLIFAKTFPYLLALLFSDARRKECSPPFYAVCTFSLACLALPVYMDTIGNR
ncbi:hypothetical protein BS50DRAFT_579505 [Corynespora cassiicola Philippines]|uniref:Uncharacterized protein n=1 Tax=Corynespora cassiicola Philippines TaxID=1448308 RepID=A0A2T2N3H9_CORCC|nr:hypothetical protein BS50DRAFT_579505 [Corynespora cassiicola Philippines]